MIKNTDLRIGNKLTKSNGEIFTVRRIDGTDDVLVEEERSLLTLNYNLSGIPLAPEILEKCGFVLNNLSDNWELEKRHNGIIGVHKEDFSLWIGDKEDEFGFTGGHGSCCNHLHQLQNLYFALTGEELTYTP